MPSTQQLAYFAALLAAGVFFLVTAFTVFLPVVMLAPSKFAVCFTTGSALVMAAFTALRGLRNQVQHMLTSDRIYFTLGVLLFLTVLTCCSYSLTAINLHGEGLQMQSESAWPSSVTTHLPLSMANLSLALLPCCIS